MLFCFCAFELFYVFHRLNSAWLALNNKMITNYNRTYQLLNRIKVNIFNKFTYQLTIYQIALLTQIRMKKQNKKGKNINEDEDFLAVLQALAHKVPNNKHNLSGDVSSLSMNDNSHIVWNLEEDEPLILKTQSEYLSDNYQIQQNIHPNRYISQKNNNNQKSGNILDSLLKLGEAPVQTPKWNNYNSIKNNFQTKDNQIKIQNILFGSESMGGFISDIQSNKQSSINKANRNQSNLLHSQQVNKENKQQKDREDSQSYVQSEVFSKTHNQQKQNSQHFSAVIYKNYDNFSEKKDFDDAKSQLNAKILHQKDNSESQIFEQSMVYSKQPITQRQSSQHFSAVIYENNKNEALNLFQSNDCADNINDKILQHQSKILHNQSQKLKQSQNQFNRLQLFETFKGFYSQDKNQLNQQNNNKIINQIQEQQNQFRQIKSNFSESNKIVSSQIDTKKSIHEVKHSDYSVEISKHNRQMSIILQKFIQKLTNMQLIPYIHYLNNQINRLKEKIKVDQEQIKNKEKVSALNKQNNKCDCSTQISIDNHLLTQQFDRGIQNQLKKIEIQRNEFLKKYNHIRRKYNLKKQQNDQNLDKIQFLNSKLKRYDNLIRRQQMQLQMMIAKFRQIQDRFYNDAFNEKSLSFTSKINTNFQSQYKSMNIQNALRQRQSKAVISALQREITQIKAKSNQTDKLVQHLENNIITLSEKIVLLCSSQDGSKQPVRISSTDIRKTRKMHINPSSSDKLKKTQSHEQINDKQQ